MLNCRGGENITANLCLNTIHESDCLLTTFLNLQQMKMQICLHVSVFMTLIFVNRNSIKKGTPKENLHIWKLVHTVSRMCTPYGPHNAEAIQLEVERFWVHALLSSFQGNKWGSASKVLSSSNRSMHKACT